MPASLPIDQNSDKHLLTSAVCDSSSNEKSHRGSLARGKMWERQTEFLNRKEVQYQHPTVTGVHSYTDLQTMRCSKLQDCNSLGFLDFSKAGNKIVSQERLPSIERSKATTCLHRCGHPNESQSKRDKTSPFSTAKTAKNRAYYSRKLLRTNFQIFHKPQPQSRLRWQKTRMLKSSKTRQKKTQATATQITKEEQYPNWLMAIKKSSSSKAPSSILQKHPIPTSKQSKIAHSLSSESDELKTDLQVTTKVPK
jgi:hypothetical protein